MCSYLLLPSRLPLWRRKWQPTPVFLPGKSQGQKNLDSYSPWYHKSQTQFKPSPPENYMFFLLLFSCSVVSDSLWPRGLQHARLPCPSLSPGAYSNSCPLSWCCHPTISFSVIPISSCLNVSQHQGLFKWVSSSYQVAKVLEFQL